MEPTRALPVPFCFQSLRPAPETSLFSFTLCVPLRSPFRYQREASCSRCGFTFAPNTASASSTSPTFFPSRLTTSTTGIISFPCPCFENPVMKLDRLLGLSRFLDENVLPGWPRHRSPHQQQVFVGIHLDHFQILGGYIGVAHMPRKMLILPDTRGKRTAANAARSAVKHRTVRGVAARVVPALYTAGKSFALANAADVHQLASLKTVHQYAVTDFGFVLRFAFFGFEDANFAHHLHRRNIGLFEMPGQRFIHTLRLDEFHQSQLRCFVSVFLLAAHLHHNAWTSLQYRAADQIAVFGKNLRHAQFNPDDSFDCHVPLSHSRSLPNRS